MRLESFQKSNTLYVKDVGAYECIQNCLKSSRKSKWPLDYKLFHPHLDYATDGADTVNR